MSRVMLYPFKIASQGARVLGRELGIRRIKPEGSKYRPRRADVVINWGNSTTPPWADRVAWLNKPSSVDLSIDKIKTFEVLKEAGVTIPEFTTSISTAKELQENGSDIVVRRSVRASKGHGIEMVYQGMDMPLAPLYVAYVKKRAEYRVHVFGGSIIDFAQKKKRREEDVDYKIRNHDNGWVYCREDVYLEENVKIQSINAVKALGLDFGAVDVIFNQHYNEAYVLEVNTAPGLVGSTIESYLNAIRGTEI